MQEEKKTQDPETNVIEYWDEKGNMLARLELPENIDMEHVDKQLFSVMYDVLERKLDNTSFSQIGEEEE